MDDAYVGDPDEIVFPRLVQVNYMDNEEIHVRCRNKTTVHYLRVPKARYQMETWEQEYLWQANDQLRVSWGGGVGYAVFDRIDIPRRQEDRAVQIVRLLTFSNGDLAYQFNVILKHKVVLHKHYTQHLVGNDVMQLLRQSDSICDQAALLFHNQDIRRPDDADIDDAKIDLFLSRMRNILKVFGATCALTCRATPLSDEEIAHFELLCRTTGAMWRAYFPECGVTPKMHMLETHAPIQMVVLVTRVRLELSDCTTSPTSTCEHLLLCRSMKRKKRSNCGGKRRLSILL